MNSKKLTESQITEIITSYESDIDTSFSSSGSSSCSSDSELNHVEFLETIKKRFKSSIDKHETYSKKDILPSSNSSISKNNNVFYDDITDNYHHASTSGVQVTNSDDNSVTHDTYNTYLSSIDLTTCAQLDSELFNLEKMPIIFDDNFVLYDDSDTQYHDNQNQCTTNILEQQVDNNPILLDNYSRNKDDTSNSAMKRTKIPKKRKKDLSQHFSGSWNFNEEQNSNYKATSFDFDTSQCGVNKHFIDDLAIDFTEFDIFKLIFDEDLVQQIVEETNKFYYFLVNNKLLKQHSKLNLWKDTDLNEMYIFIGLNLLMAHLKKNNLKDYWSTDPIIETPFFGKIMSQDRFCLLQRLLHFSDNRIPCPGNRLVKIGTVVETLKKKFKSIFIQHQNLCIDESIVEWKGRLTFKQYIPSKRHRFRIKLFVLCDCKSGFVLDFLVYTGDNQHIDFNESLSQSGSVISTLMSPYINKGHILYMDNWYSSPTLYEYLLEHKTGTCGTVKERRKGMPVFPKKLTKGQFIFAISKNPNIIACKWKDKRDVHMLSTVYTPKIVSINNCDRSGNKIKKSQCILEYNVNMGLVDKSDMQI